MRAGVLLSLLLNFQRGEVEVVEIPVLETGVSRCESCHRDFKKTRKDAGIPVGSHKPGLMGSIPIPGTISKGVRRS